MLKQNNDSAEVITHAHDLPENKLRSSFRRAIFGTLTTCLLTSLFLLFFNVSKHAPVFETVNVFAEDPYDAVGSFGIQLALLALMVSFLRILRPYPEGINVGSLSLILRGNAVALLAAAIPLTADLIAMLRYFSEWNRSSAGWALAIVVVGLMVMTLWAGWEFIRIARVLNLLLARHSWNQMIMVCLASCIVLAFYPASWRQSISGAVITALIGMILLFILCSKIAKSIFGSENEAKDDVLDDFADGMRGRLEKTVNLEWVRKEIDWLNPRKHTWHLVFLGAVGLGLALITAEMIDEGMPREGMLLTVILVYICIEASGVLLGYMLLRRFLGLFRT
jgi:hypothetical protein